MALSKDDLLRLEVLKKHFNLRSKEWQEGKPSKLSIVDEHASGVYMSISVEGCAATAKEIVNLSSVENKCYLTRAEIGDMKTVLYDQFDVRADQIDKVRSSVLIGEISEAITSLERINVRKCVEKPVTQAVIRYPQ